MPWISNFQEMDRKRTAEENSSLRKRLSEMEIEVKELRKISDNQNLKPYPLWFVFFHFLVEQSDRGRLRSFSYYEKDQKGVYLLTFQLTNDRNNQYSKSTGGEGIRSEWFRFKNDILNFYPSDTKSIPDYLSLVEDNLQQNSDDSDSEEDIQELDSPDSTIE